MAPSGDPSAPSGGLIGFLPMIIIVGLIIAAFLANPQKTHEKSELEWLLVFLLCLFGGILGLHRFYAGRRLTGFLFLISLGLFGIGYAIDFIMILFNRFLDNNGNFIMYGSSTKEPDTTKSTSPSISIAEEIAKFAELKEQGILTDEEFQAKKKEMLNR